MARYITAAVFIVGGIFFFAVGVIGLIRLPDALSRMHAAAKADTLGAGLVLLGVMIGSGLNLISVKMLFVVAFIWLTTPTATHIISQVAYRDKQFTPIIQHRVDLDTGEEGDA